jgi:hypothetical protein
MEDEVMNEVQMGHQGALNFFVERTPRNSDGTTDYLTVAAEMEGLQPAKASTISEAGRGCCPFSSG